MNPRNWSFALLVMSCSLTWAQGPSKVGFQLSAWLKTAEPTAPVDLFLAGEATALSRAVYGNGGVVKMAIPGWVLATMPAKAVPALDKDSGVEQVVFSVSKGRVLNDSMRVKAHVNEAHLGLAPLAVPYTGKGVLMGIIDTGLDFQHPDFLDSLGRTRVLRYWDQTFPFDQWLTPSGFGYGQAWDSTAINAGSCPAMDPPGWYGHGTTVASTAAGRDKPSGKFSGVAPDADLIVVANDLEHPNWGASVVDAVRYIVEQAAALGRPVAINLSLGDYFGSHDGLDPAARMIDQLITAMPGRVLVCAAGNSGDLPPYHLRTEVTADTTFTWFAYNANSILNLGAVYFELWADTADFSQVRYSIGADRYAGGYAPNGHIPFHSIQGTLGQIVMDTLWSTSGNKLGRVFTQAEVRGGQYHLEVYVPEPDSAGAFYYRFMTTGTGRFDVWSSDLLGTSKIISDIPSSAEFPPIVDYVLPDLGQSIVDSWACSPQVITVGNYNNQQHYTAMNGTVQDLGGTPGAICTSSSRGPSRTGLVKPDVAAPGDVTFSAGPLAVLQLLEQFAPEKLIDSLHMRGGGTSIASPVVAGTAALLLEKCPRATNAMVRDAIIGTAFQDSLTGAVPDSQFGNGKVHTFNALVSTLVHVPLTGNPAVCEGDSVLISGPDFMYRYQWNTGLQQRDIWTLGGDTLVLTVETPQGCKGTSDTLIVDVMPLPTAAITVDGLTMQCSTAAAYQWYLGTNPIPGASGPEWVAESNGSYFVQVTDSMGCMASSDTVLIATVGVRVEGGKGLSLWPIPATDQLHIRGGVPQLVPVPYTIIDASGRSVVQGAWPGAGGTIPVGTLAPGPYLLRLKGLPLNGTWRFIKE